MENGHAVVLEIPPLREELVCTICWDILRRPRVLSCAHVFCQTCLRSHLQEGPGSPGGGRNRGKGGSRWGGGRDEARIESGRRPSVAESGDGAADEENVQGCREIECPCCRGITQLVEEGVQNLPEPTNLDLADEWTDEELQRARGELQRRLEALREVSPRRCPVHSDESQEYFCNQCNEALCKHCVTESHQEHDCEGVAEVHQARVIVLRGALQPAFAFVEKAESMAGQLDRDEKSILTNKERCKESVREVFARMRDALDEREKAIQLTIDKYITGKVSAVADHRHRVTKGKEKVLCCIESMSRLLERAGDVSVLREDLALLEELDTQEQLILEVDGEEATAMHSSAYVGFKEDHVPLIHEEATRAVTLCEFYPESDSGYYASRKIAVDDGQVEEEDAYDVFRYGGGDGVNLRYSRSMHHMKRPQVIRHRQAEGGGRSVTVRVTPEVNLSESPTPTDSPSSSRRSSLSAASSGSFDNLSPQHALTNGSSSPHTPHRFSSLLSPLPILEPIKVFDRLGGSRKESVHPCGLCIIANDSMIVSDIKNHCLRIVASSGKFIDCIGSEGKGAGCFEEPCGVCLDNKGNILVTQRQNPRIQKFTQSGKFVSKFGQKTLRGSNLFEPWSICCASSGEMYVADWDKSCVHIFQDNGRYLCVLGSRKKGVGVKGSLLFPGGIACDSHGRILVTDRGNHCVWVIQSDGSIVCRIGNKGHAPGELYYPYGVAVTPDGKVVVSESGNHRISVFSLSGQFQHCFGRQGGQPGYFDHPRHIAFTSVGELVVVDEINERLQVFKLP